MYSLHECTCCVVGFIGQDTASFMRLEKCAEKQKSKKKKSKKLLRFSRYGCDVLFALRAVQTPARPLNSDHTRSGARVVLVVVFINVIERERIVLALKTREYNFIHKISHGMCAA